MDKIIDLEKEYATLNVRLQLLESMMVNLMNTQAYQHPPNRQQVRNNSIDSIQIQDPEPELIANKPNKTNIRQRKNVKNRYIY